MATTTTTAATDLKESLKAKFAEELADVNKYFDLADQAKQEGDTYLAHWLCEIAKDEYTHVKFLRDYLIDSGMTITTEQEMKWHEIKDRVAHKFR